MRLPAAAPLQRVMMTISGKPRFPEFPQGMLVHKRCYEAPWSFLKAMGVDHKGQNRPHKATMLSLYVFLSFYSPFHLASWWSRWSWWCWCVYFVAWLLALLDCEVYKGLKFKDIMKYLLPEHRARLSACFLGLTISVLGQLRRLIRMVRGRSRCNSHLPQAQLGTSPLTLLEAKENAKRLHSENVIAKSSTVYLPKLIQMNQSTKSLEIHLSKLAWAQLWLDRGVDTGVVDAILTCDGFWVLSIALGVWITRHDQRTRSQRDSLQNLSLQNSLCVSRDSGCMYSIVQHRDHAASFATRHSRTRFVGVEYCYSVNSVEHVHMCW